MPGDDLDVGGLDAEFLGQETAKGIVGAACLGWGGDLDLQAISQAADDLIFAAAGDGLDGDSGRGRMGTVGGLVLEDHGGLYRLCGALEGVGKGAARWDERGEAGVA